jgi:transposase-like protein
MTDKLRATAGASERAHHAGGDAPAAPRKRRMSTQRKQEAVLTLLRGEDLELVSRELGVTAADLSGWRYGLLTAGAASLKSRPEDDRDRHLRAMKEKIGDLTMANELLEAKIDRIEAGARFSRRRVEEMSRTVSPSAKRAYGLARVRTPVRKSATEAAGGSRSGRRKSRPRLPTVIRFTRVDVAVGSQLLC